MCNAHTPLRENMYKRTTNIKLIVKHKLTSPKNRRIIKIINDIDQLITMSLSANFYLKAQVCLYWLISCTKKHFFVFFATPLRISHFSAVIEINEIQIKHLRVYKQTSF
ncbi:MAG: hypothetical protein ACJAWI_000570 [Marinomonas primoryensis]|jgi:hypothetical protein